MQSNFLKLYLWLINLVSIGKNHMFCQSSNLVYDSKGNLSYVMLQQKLRPFSHYYLVVCLLWEIKGINPQKIMSQEYRISYFVLVVGCLELCLPPWIILMFLMSNSGIEGEEPLFPTFNTWYGKNIWL